MRAIRSGELADRAFARWADEVPDRDRAWLHELVYGTLRLRGRIDYLVNGLVKRGIDSIDADVLDVLRLGAYQLLEMRSVPAYAAVSQSVELTKSLRTRGVSGFVNGVLQSLARAQPHAEPVGMETAVRLATWGSHPQWLVERWLTHFGGAGTEALIAANNTRPDLYLRVVGMTEAEAVARAGAAGITLAPVSNAAGAMMLADGRVEDALAAVPAVVQDPAGGLVASYADAQSGIIADVCAAPGGKAVVLANAASAHGGVVVASDVSPVRLQKAIENAQRIGGLPLHFTVADARVPALGVADMVFIDAPCTGTGTFRRHPDGKWRVGPRDLHALVQLQRDILDAACELVRVGGILVYATCSLEPEENHEQVRDFLDRHPSFLRRPPSAWQLPEMIDEAGNLVIHPQTHGFDGAFAARLERVA